MGSAKRAFESLTCMDSAGMAAAGLGTGQYLPRSGSAPIKLEALKLNRWNRIR